MKNNLHKLDIDHAILKSIRDHDDLLSSIQSRKNMGLLKYMKEDMINHRNSCVLSASYKDTQSIIDGGREIVHLVPFMGTEYMFRAIVRKHIDSSKQIYTINRG